MNVNVNIDAVNAQCGIIRQIGMTPGLAGKFFTVSTKHAFKDFEKIKESIESNPQAPNLFINRPIPTFDIKSHVVLAQAVETDATGNVKVVFNPGTDEEAKATVVAGGIGFGEPTSEAIQKAIGPNGQDVIFADGKKLLKETNDLIDGQIAWIDALTAALLVTPPLTHRITPSHRFPILSPSDTRPMMCRVCPAAAFFTAPRRASFSKNEPDSIALLILRRF